MDIFSVTPNGRVQTAFWNGSAWNGWHQLGSLDPDRRLTGPGIA
jgi:hypothetical protein